MLRWVLLCGSLGALVACGQVGIKLLPEASGRMAPPDAALSGRDGGNPAAYDGSDAAVDAGSMSSLDGGDGGMDSSIAPICPTSCTNDHGSADCSAGQCQLNCAIGYADCDGNPDNGCETAIDGAPTNCGACDRQCTTAYGTTTCTQGLCTPSCAAEVSGDCDGNPQNGCEADLTSDSQACGSCGTACTNDNGTTSCQSGACTPVCAAGYADCDGDPTNGCETNIASDPDNCGACGAPCDTSFQVCADQTCQVSMCPQGSGDCDSNPSDCETDLTSTVQDCGFCGNQCSTPNATPTCSASACEIASCNAGFADCDSSAKNGCEANLDTSTANCGGCGMACSNPHGTISCTAGSCAPGCSSGWDSCDADLRNGCETALDTVSNCGNCGNVCPNSLPGASAVCTSGVCGYVCDALSGVYALRIDAQVSWPAQQYVRAGSGTAQFWLRLTLTQSGTTLSGTAQLCDQTTPEFRNSVTTDRYLIAYPSALFTPGAPGAAFNATLASLSPGAALASTPAAHLLGIAMSDPVNGSWPSASTALASQVDHDADGKVGITVNFVNDSTYNYVQTSASLFAARASAAYGEQRLRFSLAGALSSCAGASGAATVQSFDTQTIGCRLESGQDCSTSQYTHLQDNAVVYSANSASYAMTRLGGEGSSFTCAQVRSAL